MRGCILLNPRAGAAGTAATLREAIDKHPNLTLRGPTSFEETRQCISEALEAGCDTLVAAGGDGTVHTVINALAPHFERARVAILPLGTGNDLCRTLAIPNDLQAALALLDAGRERRLDLIRVETPTRRLYCANVAAGGFTGQLEELLTDDVKAWWGPLAYLRGAVNVLPNLTGYQTTLRLDDGAVERIEAFNLLIANGRMAGAGLNVAPRANPEDGLMEVIAIRYGALLDLTAVGALLLTGDYLTSDQVIHQRARRLHVHSTPGMWFSIDGELLGNEPVTFTVEPRALRVLVGPDYQPEPEPG